MFQTKFVEIKHTKTTHFRRFCENCEKRLLAPSRYLSVRPSACNNSAPKWTDFHEILYLNDLSIICRVKSIFSYVDMNERHISWRPVYISYHISLPFPLGTINVSDKRDVEKIKTHFVFSNTFYFKYTDFYDRIWGISVERGRPQITTRLMRTACWVPKATNTHPQYVIIIVFPRPR